MSRLFEELDHRETPIGALSLRCRRDLALDLDVFEIKLGDEFLMSSLFTVSEIALARLGLAELAGEALEIAVGGLGLGYTARAVLDEQRTGALLVIDLLGAVIDWHRQGLLPLGPGLTADPRCRFVEGDFFALAASQDGLDPLLPGRRFHAILVDIDHSPQTLLDSRSSGFYSEAGLARRAHHLRPGGVFGLWSNDRTDPDFLRRLDAVFDVARAEPVTFLNPLQDRPCTQTVYLARRAK